MEFNKQTVKALLGVVCGGIAFAAALLHLDVVAGAAGWLLGILSPLLLGCAIAFILNVPMRALERCLFPHAKKPISSAAHWRCCSPLRQYPQCWRWREW